MSDPIVTAPLTRADATRSTIPLTCDDGRACTRPARVGERGCIDTVYATAIAADVAGICVVPPKQDGSKAPDVRSWAVYQRRRTTEKELTHWFADLRRTGIGYVCGQVSGGLELLDFDDRASAWRRVQPTGRRQRSQRRVATHRAGATGSGRRPVGITSSFAPRSRPARSNSLSDPSVSVERQHERDLWQSLIETKGEGGFTVVAPSHGMVHRSGGAYEMVSGGVTSIATITAEERDALLAVARMLDQKPRPLFTSPASAGPSMRHSTKPGDRYNAETCVGDIAATLRLDHRSPMRRHGLYWTRPGKDRGVSATHELPGQRPAVGVHLVHRARP